MHRVDPQYPHTDDENIESTGKNNWANGLLGILPTDFFPMVCLRPSSVLYYIYDIKSLGDSSDDARVAFGGDSMEQPKGWHQKKVFSRHGVAKNIMNPGSVFCERYIYLVWDHVPRFKMVVYLKIIWLCSKRCTHGKLVFFDAFPSHDILWLV